MIVFVLRIYASYEQPAPQYQYIFSTWEKAEAAMARLVGDENSPYPLAEYRGYIWEMEVDPDIEACLEFVNMETT